MPEKSGFFDSTGTDVRTYPARDFADYFAQLLTSGVFNGGQYLNPTATGTNATVSLSPGYAWIKGYVYSIYDTPLPLTVQPAAALPRIDRLILRLDTSLATRSIQAMIIQGVPGSNPNPPGLTRAGEVYDLAIAQIRVNANTTIITQANITDERLNSAVCGLVNSLVQVDTTTFQQQFDAFMETIADEGFATTQYVDNRVLTGGYGATTNSGNVYSVTLNPAPTALVAGLRATVRINSNNTGAVTINVNGLGARQVLKSNGGAMTANGLRSGSVYSLVYNGTAFILQGEGGEYGTAVAGDVRSSKTIGTDSGLVTGTLITRDSTPVIITPNGSIQTLNPGIYDNQITFSAGVGFATGNVVSSLDFMYPSSGPQTAFYYVTVSGVGFRPNRIILRYTSFNGNIAIVTYDFTTNNSQPTQSGSGFNYAVVSVRSTTIASQGFAVVNEYTGVNLPSSGFAITDSSFRLPVNSPEVNVKWEAYKV